MQGNHYRNIFYPGVQKMFELQQVVSDTQVILRFNDIGLTFLLNKVLHYIGKLVTEPGGIAKIPGAIGTVCIEMNDPIAFGCIGYFKIGNAVVGYKCGDLNMLLNQHAGCMVTVGADATTVKGRIFCC